MNSSAYCIEYQTKVVPTLYGKPTDTYRYVCLALQVISTLYFVIGFLLYLYYKNRYVRLQSRSMYLTLCITVAFLVFNTTIYYREYLGRQYFRCQILVWMFYISIYYATGACIGNLFTYIYKLRVQRDQGFQLMNSNKNAHRQSKTNDGNQKTETTNEGEHSALYYAWDYFTVLKYSKNGRIVIPGHEEKDDGASLNGSESVTGSNLFVFTNESQSGDFTTTMFERFKEEFVYPTIVLFIIGSPIVIAGLVRMRIDPAFIGGCMGCSLNYIDYIIIAACLLLNAFVMSIGSWSIRNEADPLGVVSDAKIGAACGIMGMMFCIIQIYDPQHLYKDYKFSWDILFSFFTCVFYFPVVYGHLLKSYLERRARHINSVSSVAIHQSNGANSSPVNTRHRYSTHHLPPASSLDVNLIISEPRARNALLEHCIDELSSENLVFVFKVRAWKSLWDKESAAKVNKIAMNLFNEYISRSSKSAINIPNSVYSKFETVIEQFTEASESTSRRGSVSPTLSNKIPLHAFDECETECLNIIKTDTLPRFRNSALFRERIVETGILGKIMN